MSTDTRQDARPTYGGWRKVKGMGVFGLSGPATIMVLVLIMLGFTALQIQHLIGVLAYLPIGVPLLIATVVNWKGETTVQRLVRRVRWARGRRKGWTMLDGMSVAEYEGAWQLPGLLAGTRLIDVIDDRGNSFGLVLDRNSGLMTALVAVDARSTWLVDQHMADAWVAGFHHLLAATGLNPMVAWMAVTVETGSEPGSTLVELVADRMDPRSPEDARMLLAQLVDAAPRAARSVATYVSVTFDPSQSARRLTTMPERVEEVARALPGLVTAIGGCGVEVLRVANAGEVCGLVRKAYDPGSRGEVARILAGDPDEASRLLTWGDAGPVHAYETDDGMSYRHDTGMSASYTWIEAPRQQVMSDVLDALLAPGRFDKRVTLLFRPLPVAEAARALEAEVNATAARAEARRRARRDDSARDAADRERATAAAREEAQGAGVVRISLYATTTVTDPADLNAAAADLEQRAAASKIRLRRLVGGQAAGFQATLGVGIHPARCHPLRNVTRELKGLR